RTSRPTSSPTGARSRTICLHERARRPDVRGSLSPNADAARAGRQDAVRNPSAHVAACNRLQAGQSGRGYPVTTALSRPQEHPAYGSIHRTFSRTVPRFLERLGACTHKTRVFGNRSLTSASPPKADKGRHASLCPLCARSGHWAGPFNHLVGPDEQG